MVILRASRRLSRADSPLTGSVGRTELKGVLQAAFLRGTLEVFQLLAPLDSALAHVIIFFI